VISAPETPAPSIARADGIQLPTDRQLGAFMKRIGIQRLDRSLLRLALTHRSLMEGTDGPDNERLEFLGDSILGMIVGECLFERHPDFTEGQLTRLKARIVSRPSLAEAAAQIDLGALVGMAASELTSGGRERPGTLADAFEALIAAIYLGRGLAVARDFVERHLLQEIDPLEVWDYKSRLQELMQAKRHATPTYRILKQIGPAHDRQFVAEAIVKGQVFGRGAGRSKKDAEQQAAANALASVDSAGRRKRTARLALSPSLIDT